MTTPTPPTNDDALSPDERALAQLYRQLSDAEPDVRLDTAVLAQARAAVAQKPRLTLTRWSVGFASAAVLVLAAGIVWRSEMASTPAALPRSNMPNQPATQTHVQEKPQADVVRMQAEPSYPPAKVIQEVSPPPAARRATTAVQLTSHAAADNADETKLVALRAGRLVTTPPRQPPPAFTPSTELSERRAQASVDKQVYGKKMSSASLAHENAQTRAAPPAPPAPPAPKPPPAAEAAMAAPAAALMQARDAAPSPASSSATNGDRTAAQRVERIRHLLRDGQRAQAMKDLHALRKVYPDYPIPADLRGLQTH